MRVLHKNPFASAGVNFDLQRADLFKFSLNLPVALNLKWHDTVEWAVEKFPFPARERESIPVKYLQQTNHAIGGDAAMSPIEVTARYAFAQQTIEALEKWHSLVANERTGGVGLTSQVKANGHFRWLIPNMTQQVADLSQANPSSHSTTLKEGGVYTLEGCWIKSLRFSDSDQATGSEHATILFSIQIDRWYPENITNLVAVP